MESYHQPPSFSFSEPIREVIYALMKENLESSEKTPHQEEIKVTEQDTHGKQTKEVLESEVTQVDPKSVRKSDAEFNSEVNSKIEENSNTGNESKENSEVDNSKLIKEITDISTESSGHAEFVEYTRHIKDLRKVAVSPRQELASFQILPSFSQIPDLSLEERKLLFMETLGVGKEFLAQFDDSLQVFMSSLVFWVQNSRIPGTNVQQFQCIVLSAVILHIHKELLQRDEKMLNWATGLSESKSEYTSTQKSASLHRNLLCIKDGVLSKIRDNLRKYYHVPAKVDSKHPAEPEIYQHIARFQACLCDAVNLNSLLLNPFPCPEPALLINGSFIYTMTVELQKRSNPDLFLAEMLVKGSSALSIFQCLCASVIERVGEKAFVEKAKGHKVGKKKEKREKNKTKKIERDDKTTESSEREDKENSVYDVNNRFSALLLDCDE